ncbi:MAG: helix-turn-helix domain-containing protein [Fastidiosipilaceae bacterium]|jgi:AraC family transcriptional regulator
MPLDEPKGIMECSRILFRTPSKFAKEALFYFTHIGEAWCDTTYYVNRESFNSYLIMLMVEGQMRVTFDDVIYKAGPDSVIFLDCYKPHEYRAFGNIHFYFIHFDGVTCEAYFRHLRRQCGTILQLPERSPLRADLLVHYEEILLLASHPILNEQYISIQIHNFLYKISRYKEKNIIGSDAVSQGIMYIEQNLASISSIQDIANHVNLEVCYFSKLFKCYTHQSPHAYLTNRRIDYAKQLLWSHNASIEEIAIKTGFQNTTSFYRAFKRITGYAPSEFRNL